MSRALLPVLAAVLLAAVCAAAALSPVHVDPATLQMVDAEGRVRLFHGVNVVYKVPPYYPQLDAFDPQLSLSAQDVAQLNEWGFNVVRLYTAWPGVQPAPGTVNQTYLETLETMVASLGDAGIYSLLDCHQDVYSRKFCGEGAPDHAVHYSSTDLQFPQPVIPYPYSVDPATGYPPLNECFSHTFAEYYMAESTGEAFQSLYDNTQGTTDQFVAFWKAVASQFRGNTDVLGYEIINEPWAGDVYSHPELLKPGEADRHNLKHFYETLASAIRSGDDDHLVFFEPTVIISALFDSGLEDVPGGDAYRNRSVYSYHIYCGDFNATGPKSRAVCDAMDIESFDIRASDRARIKAVGFMTEFGALDNSTASIAEVDYMTMLADTYLQSWTYWQYKTYNDITTQAHGQNYAYESFYNGDGQLEMNKVASLSRTYARAIAGLPTRMMFDPDTRQFDLTYITNSVSATQQTEIYLNEAIHYADGYQVAVSPSDITYSSPQRNIIMIDAHTLAAGMHVAVRITAGSSSPAHLNVQQQA